MEQKIDDVEAVIRDYIAQVVHMSLATCANNKPWVCEAHFAYDDELNLYFVSKPSRRHSQEIAANPNVAGNIVMQHAKGEKPRGTYFEGTAELLQVMDDQHPAFRAYDERLGISERLREEIMNNPEGHKFYKITVANWYLFDTRESDPSRKYQLPWKV